MLATALTLVRGYTPRMLPLTTAQRRCGSGIKARLSDLGDASGSLRTLVDYPARMVSLRATSGAPSRP